MRPVERGFTLLEAVLAATLAGLLLTLIVQVLVPMARGTVGMADQAQVESLALVILGSLESDLQNTSAAGLSAVRVAGSSQALALHPLAGINPQGKQYWDDHLIVWWWSSGDKLVHRRVWPPGPPTLSWSPTPQFPVRVAAADFPSLTVAAPGVRNLGKFVEDFAVTGIDSGGYVTPPLTVHLRLQQPSTRPSGKAEIDMQRTLYLHNSTSSTRQEKPP